MKAFVLIVFCIFIFAAATCGAGVYFEWSVVTTVCWGIGSLISAMLCATLEQMAVESN